MNGPGCIMSQESVEQIVELLTSTELTISEIADCMLCSRSTVLSINRRFQVRRIVPSRMAGPNIEKIAEPVAQSAFDELREKKPA